MSAVDERRHLLLWTIEQARDSMRQRGHDPHPHVVDARDPWHAYATCRRCGAQVHATSQPDRVVLVDAQSFCSQRVRS